MPRPRGDRHIIEALIRRLDRLSDGAIATGLCAIGLSLIALIFWTAQTLGFV